MQQTFTRIESGDNKYYLLTNLFNGGKDGFDLTVCSGEQVWRETGTLHIYGSKLSAQKSKCRKTNSKGSLEKLEKL